MNTWDYSSDLEPFEKYLSAVLSTEAPPPHKDLFKFWEGMEYSLFGGGKRFRPLLCILTAKALGKDPTVAYPLAAALEMIHTYSLIHDDLPCLDNDDERRGRPTHHKVFGEDMALLAGDALQSMAFFVLANDYKDHPHLSALIKSVALAAGPQGMVGGQVLDMLADQETPGEELLKRIHELKTGVLISVCVHGTAEVCLASDSEKKLCKDFGDKLGLAFQISDDLQDHQEGEESKNFAFLVGPEKTKDWLHLLSKESHSLLDQMTGDTSGLKSLVEFNLQRV